MKIYIQSKSGDFNSSLGLAPEFASSLTGAFFFLREAGSYGAVYRGKPIEVPFEEIQFIRALEEGD